MSKTLLFETKSVLAQLKKMRDAVNNQCRAYAEYEPLILAKSHRKGSLNERYYLKRRGEPGRHYLGKDSAKIVNEIRSARYFRQLQQIIERDIQILESVDREFVIPEHDSINGLLPKVYRNESPPAVMHVSPEAKEWKRRMEAKKEKYPPYRPEELTYSAKDGTMMRSLSEVIIANYLLSLGITFVYELPFTHNGKMTRPDFTILSPVDNKTVIIIEHQGAMGNEDYQNKFIRTLLFYLGTKLVPNKDVFFTFSHLDRNLDLRQIDYILHTAFGSDLPQQESSRQFN